jgi:hypothetical protein
LVANALAVVADIDRTAAAPLRATARAIVAWRPVPARRRVGRLEAQPAAHRIGLGEPQGEALAERVEFAAFLADQALARLVVAEIFPAERGGRHQAVAAPFQSRLAHLRRAEQARVRTLQRLDGGGTSSRSKRGMRGQRTP